MSVNGIGSPKKVTNCMNTYDEGTFSDSIPAVGKAGYKWSIQWREGSKKGEWCYVSQALPKFYAGGLYMNYTLSKDVQFIIRTTQASGSIVQYYNHTSIKLSSINHTIPMLDASLIDMYLHRTADMASGVTSDFKLDFHRITANGVIKKLQLDQSVYIIWMVSFILLGIVYCFLLLLYRKLRAKEAWEQTDFVQKEDVYVRV